MSSSVNPELFVSGISMLRRWKRNGSGAKDGNRANKESRKWDQKSIPLGNCNRRGAVVTLTLAAKVLSERCILLCFCRRSVSNFRLLPSSLYLSPNPPRFHLRWS